MKNLLLSLVVIIAATFCSVSTASAERTYEKRENVVRLIVKTKTGYELFLREWTKPVTTLIKTCNGVPTHECIYVIKHGREVFLYSYQAGELTFPRYKFETKIAQR